MHTSHRVLVVLAATSILDACRDSTGTVTPAGVRVAVVTPGRSGRVDFTVTNSGTKRIDLGRCWGPRHA